MKLGFDNKKLRLILLKSIISTFNFSNTMRLESHSPNALINLKFVFLFFVNFFTDLIVFITVLQVATSEIKGHQIEIFIL